MWTFAHVTRAPKQIRLLTDALFEKGYRPIILRCDGPECRIYRPGFTREELLEHINRVRQTDDSYVQIKPAPQE